MIPTTPPGGERDVAPSRDRDAYPELLIEECESFLAGAYVERCEARE